MAILALVSFSGAPGCTTTAVGLGLHWPRPVVVVDANRDPSQSVLAGYLHGMDAGRRGLSGLLLAHREHRPLADDLDAQFVPLAIHEPDRRYLPGFTHPGAAALFQAGWPELLAALDQVPGDVILDCGRLGREGLPLPIAQAADAVAVVCRSNLVSLAALRLYLPGLADLVEPSRLGLLLVGEGRPYRRAEIEQQFGIRVWLSVPFDEAGSAVYAEGAEPPRRFADSAYVGSLRQAGQVFAGRFDGERRLIGAAR